MQVDEEESKVNGNSRLNQVASNLINSLSSVMLKFVQALKRETQNRAKGINIIIKLIQGSLVSDPNGSVSSDILSENSKLK